MKSKNKGKSPFDKNSILGKIIPSESFKLNAFPFWAEFGKYRIFTPVNELEIKPNTKHVALHDLLGENYVDPIFVKPNEVSLFNLQAKDEATKPIITNEALSKTIAIGLNDRIGFVQHLFKDSNEDFNRVISQLNTFDTFEEAKDFINEMVIPDYNYWVGEEDYIERFMAIVEKKFV